jgi:TatA/E family protein of Tat protein translocase
MGTLGVQEMVVIFLLALVLFGPKKLPELGRTIGKALTEFRRASSDLKATYEREMQNLERENDSLKQVTHNAAKDIYDHPNFDYGYNDQSQDATASHHDSTATENPPNTVGASAVPGAESQGNTETATAVIASDRESNHEAHPAVEGTVPRSGAPETPKHT